MLRSAHVCAALLACAATPALAAPVLVASVPVSAAFGGYAQASLPQWDGGAPITSVTLTLTGTTATWEDLFGDPDFPYVAPAQDVSWRIGLVSLDPSRGYEIGGQDINSQFPSILVDNFFVTRSTPTLSFNIVIHDTALDLYAGSGAQDFLVVPNSAWEGTHFDGVLTEYINAAIPEPATWAMMILGLGGAGVALRRRPHRFAAPSV